MPPTIKICAAGIAVWGSATFCVTIPVRADDPGLVAADVILDAGSLWRMVDWTLGRKSGALVTLWDPVSGKTEDLERPAYDEPDASHTFWRPVYREIAGRLAKRGLGERAGLALLMRTWAVACCTSGAKAQVRRVLQKSFMPSPPRCQRSWANIEPDVGFVDCPRFLRYVSDAMMRIENPLPAVA